MVDVHENSLLSSTLLNEYLWDIYFMSTTSLAARHRATIQSEIPWSCGAHVLDNGNSQWQ